MSISDFSAANEWIKTACKALGLQEDIKVIQVVNRWRWTIEYTQSPDHPDFTQHILRLEKILQATLNRPIDLRLESLSDKNRRKQRNVLSESKLSSG